MALFEEPSGVDFDAVGTFAHWDAAVAGDFGLGFGKVDVFEERARRGFFGRVGEFIGANGRNDSADASRAEVGQVVVGHVVFDGSVKWARHDTDAELKSDRNDEIATDCGGV